MPGHVLGPGLEPGPEPGLQRLKYGHVGDVFALALELRSSKETESRLPHEAARPHLAAGEWREIVAVAVAATG